MLFLFLSLNRPARSGTPPGFAWPSMPWLAGYSRDRDAPWPVADTFDISPDGGYSERQHPAGPGPG